MARQDDPFDRELLPLLDKEHWETTLVTVTDAYQAETQYGTRVVLECVTFNDCAQFPRGESVALMLGDTVVRRKMLTYFEQGGLPVGPCTVQKNDKGIWVIRRVKDAQD